MTEKNYKESWTLWQEVEDGLGEPAIVVELYSDGMVCLTQEGRDININYESIDELCKLLKKLKNGKA
jgi:hypothetical protein